MLVVALAAQPAAAQDDDDGTTFEGRFLRGLFGGNKPVIEYRERSPLVIPPNGELPAPDGTTAAAAAPAPNWPNDPDIARRRKLAKDGEAPYTNEWDKSERPLSPGEMRRGKTTRRDRSREPERTLSDAEMMRALRPSELNETKTVFGMFSNGSKVEPFTGEPERSRLVDPPAGYRTPAPTQPYAPPKSSGNSWTPFNWFDHQTKAAER